MVLRLSNPRIGCPVPVWDPTLPVRGPRVETARLDNAIRKSTSRPWDSQTSSSDRAKRRTSHQRVVVAVETAARVSSGNGFYFTECPRHLRLNSPQRCELRPVDNPKLCIQETLSARFEPRGVPIILRRVSNSGDITCDVYHNSTRGDVVAFSLCTRTRVSRRKCRSEDGATAGPETRRANHTRAAMTPHSQPT